MHNLFRYFSKSTEGMSETVRSEGDQITTSTIVVDGERPTDTGLGTDGSGSSTWSKRASSTGRNAARQSTRESELTRDLQVGARKLSSGSVDRVPSANQSQVKEQARKVLEKLKTLEVLPEYSKRESLSREERRVMNDTMSAFSSLTDVQRPAVKEVGSLKRSRPSVSGDVSQEEIQATKKAKFDLLKPILPKHPPDDRDDEWFDGAFKGLHTATQTFVGLLCKVDLVVPENGPSPWLSMLPEFVRYTTTMVESDPISGGWDKILTDRGNRQHLLLGVLARVFDVKVFKELLFGGDKEQAEYLENFEKVFVHQDGYTRTALRATTIRTMLGDDTVPWDFQRSITLLATQITSLLAPLTEALKPAYREQRVDFPSANEQFQELHTAVTHAAFLSICMRLSPTIFHIYFERPGGDFREENFNLDHEAYLASKAAVAADTGSFQEKAGEKTQGNAYGPVIKFVVWPSVKRYKPGNGLVGGENTGQRVYNISRCGVVYYWGRHGRCQRTSLGLQDFIASKKGGKRWRFGW